MKRWQSLLLGLAISGVALYFTLRSIDLGRVAEELRAARWGWAVAATLMIAASTYIRGLRWSAILQGRISALDGMWLFNTGSLFNNVLPARLGEVARAYLAGRRTGMRFASALSSIVVERLLDMVIVVAMLGGLLLILPVPTWAQAGGLAMGVMAGVGLVVLYLVARFPDPALELIGRAVDRLPWFERESVLSGLRPYVDGLAAVTSLRVFLAGVGWSLVAWAASALAGWLLLLAFLPGAGLTMGFLAITAAGLGVAVPGAPAAVGTFEFAVTQSLAALGISEGMAFGYAIVLHAINLGVTSVLGVLGLMREGASFGEVARAARTLKGANAETEQAYGRPTT
jgi:uncharacterized protein (TIRG00374 family)